jgi:hypothetical protein
MSEDVQRTLGRLEGKLDQFLSKLADESKRTDNHDKRLLKLERWQAWTFGAAASAGLCAAAVFKIYSMIPHGK